MGKIRIKTLGTEEEEAQKERAKIRREEKKKRLVHIAGLKGGQRIADMSATTPEVALPEEKPEEKEKAQKKIVRRQRSKAYQKAKSLVDKNKLYSLAEALLLLKNISLTKFDGTVEVHINTTEKGLRGQVKFPYGTGKQLKVAVANEALIEQLNNGKIDFDILVASPAMMPKLVKFGKLLGPRGLMPNPKTGTISDNPEKLAKELLSGQVQFKSESEAPIIHMVIGKLSFPQNHLEENFKALINAIGPQKIKSIFLKSTMSPSLRIKI